MSAGHGIRHSEQNASPTERVHFLQMWVPPDVTGIAPEYEEVDVTDRLRDDALLPLASGREDAAAIRIHQKDATLWVGRLRAGAAVTVPDAPFVHVFVARGSADLEGAGHLDSGDAVRLTDAGARALTAGAEGAEVTIWETYSEAR
jgi:redox-sensitive bicupin YhaK (pirin superfamily)